MKSQFYTNFMLISIIDITWIEFGAGMVVLLGLREKIMNVKYNEVDKVYKGSWKSFFNCKVTSKIKGFKNMLERWITQIKKK